MGAMSDADRPSEGTEDGEPATRATEHDGYRAGDEIGGKYRLVHVLGVGGMGCVWRAKNPTLQIDVALKLIRREMASPEAAQRLLQEARAAARLGHPSIVRVMDFGETERHDPFLVMELLDGESLSDLLDRKRRLSADRAVRTLLPIAAALAAAHEHGIVHRDLKPDNVILVPQPGGAVVPKLVDFGIAKLRADGPPRSIRLPAGAPVAEAANAGNLTRAGDVLGSPSYMSPEQARGTADVDARTDVWALCVMLYECVVGTGPFARDDDEAILNAILLDDPPLPSEQGADDGGLWPVLERGMDKDPASRWPTMRELGAELARWARARGVDTDVAGSSLASHWLGANKVTDTQLAGADELATLDHAQLVERARKSASTSSPQRAEPADEPAVDPAPVAASSKPPWALIGLGLVAIAITLTLALR
jgi:serine/threonine-protein kinase